MLLKSRSAYRHVVVGELKKDGIENPTGEDVLNYLFEDRSEYTLKKYEKSTTTFVQRFNYLWVFPLYLISIPFQWLIRGKVGVESESKMGKILTRLLGNL